MKKYRVRLNNNSWLSFDEETGEIKLPEHFGVDLMYNNDLMQIPNKIIENTILMKQAGDKAINKINELQERINKSIDILESIYMLDNVTITNNAVEKIDKSINILKGSDNNE